MTTGKRIAAARARLGWSQEQLAAKMGVNAQTVIKWELDRESPDLTVLPKLADLLGTTTDSLLGRTVPVKNGEVVGSFPPQQKRGYDRKRLDTLSVSALVLLVGCVMLVAEILHLDISFWNLLWPSALLVLGVRLLWDKFTFFSLGCILFGGYFLLENTHVIDLDLSSKLFFPIILLIFGLSLMMSVLKRPKDGAAPAAVSAPGQNHFETDGDRFFFTGRFGEQSELVTLRRMSGGVVTVSFGEFELDLSDVGEVTDGCTIDAKCSFGELTLLVPRCFRVECDGHSSFGEVETKGAPDSEPIGTILLKANATFGQIQLRYI